MEEIKRTIPTDEILATLNPEGIEIDMDMIAADVELDGDDLIQDTFNSDAFDELNDEGAEAENIC